MSKRVYTFDFYLSAWLYQQKFCPAHQIIKVSWNEYHLILPGF